LNTGSVNVSLFESDTMRPVVWRPFTHEACGSPPSESPWRWNPISNQLGAQRGDVDHVALHAADLDPVAHPAGCRS
jgi:hypothetical protein